MLFSASSEGLNENQAVHYTVMPASMPREGRWSLSANHARICLCRATRRASSDMLGAKRDKITQAHQTKVFSKA